MNGIYIANVYNRILFSQKEFNAICRKKYMKIGELLMWKGGGMKRWGEHIR